MQITPYGKTQVRCLRCKGAGCSACNKQGSKERILYQIDGVDFEHETVKNKEIPAEGKE